MKFQKMGLRVALAVFVLVSLFVFSGRSASAGSMSEPMTSGGIVSPPKPPDQSDSFPGKGFVLEGFAGSDTSLAGSYRTTSGQTVPYDFGTSPVWGVRIGKMLFPKLLAYLTVQQSDFSQNTHTVIGLGGNEYLPSFLGKTVFPYLNATFGASYNTYTGVNAQAGYAWMLGGGVLFPVSPMWGIFIEANLSFETAPTGITTSLGRPPGTVSQVSDTWSVPVMMGVRYSF